MSWSHWCFIVNAINLGVLSAIAISGLCISSQPFFIPSVLAQPSNSMSHSVKETPYNVGRRLMRQGKYEQAIALFTNLIEQNSELTEAYLERGIAYVLFNQERRWDFPLREQVERAIADLSLVLDREPDNARALFYRLTALEQLGSDAAAEQDRATLEALHPTDLETAYFRTWGNIDMVEEDETFYAAVVQFPVQTPQDYVYRAYYYRALGNNEAEIADYTEAIRQHPDFVSAYMERAKAYFRQWQTQLYKLEDGELEELDDDDFTPFDDADLDDEATLDIEDFSDFDDADCNAALNDLATVLDINPNFIAAYWQQAAMFVEQRNRQGIETAHEGAIAIDPLSGYYHRGEDRERMDDLQGALNDFSEAIELAPNMAVFYDARARVYESLGNREGAIADYETIVRLTTAQSGSPFTDSYSVLYRAYDSLLHWYQDRGDLAAAEIYATGLIEVSPNEPGSYLTRAMLRHERDHYTGAIADYTAEIDVVRAVNNAEIDEWLQYQIVDGHSEEAVDQRRNALLDQENPGLSEPCYGRASVWFALEQYSQALDDVNQAIHHFSDSIGGINQIACPMEDEVSLTIHDFPGCSAYYELRSRIHQQLGHPDEQRQDYALAEQFRQEYVESIQDMCQPFHGNH